MKNLAFAFVLLGIVWFALSCEGTKRAKNFNDKTNVDAEGISFMRSANEAGLIEVKASALAESMSKNPRIVKFAKMMMGDHSQIGEELSGIAKDKFVDLADTLTIAHQKTIDSLAHLTSGFDAAYMSMMVSDHEKAVNLFNEADVVKNPDLKKFAKKTLPVLKLHLDSAKAIQLGIK